jgi:glycosyltransferase involved in cell wall biosynthesis
VRILWASPLPPVRSGVSDYAVELLPELARVSDVRVLADPHGSGPEPGATVSGCPVVDGSTRPESGEIQLVHLGNNPYHRWLIDRLQFPRTVVVLHDAVLHHLLVEATLAQGNERRFAGLLLEAHPEAEALVRARAAGLSGPRDAFLFPARRAFLQGLSGIVVHSRWAEHEVARDRPELPVSKVGLSVEDPGTVDRGRLRQHLQIGHEELLVMHLGFLTPQKGLHDLLGAVAAVRRQQIPARLMIVGEGEHSEALGSLVRGLGIEDWVGFTGFVAPEEFPPLPAAADLGVVLRSPSAGETSAAALRFLACGTPVAVSALHQFLELPEAAAPRVTPGPSATAELARIVSRAHLDPGGWAKRRSAARNTYLSDHTPRVAAGQLVAALAKMAR